MSPTQRVYPKGHSVGGTTGRNQGDVRIPCHTVVIYVQIILTLATLTASTKGDGLAVSYASYSSVG